VSREAWIEPQLNALRKERLDREVAPYSSVGGKVDLNGTAYLNFASNDYLNLARHPEVVTSAEQALRRYGAGATASRLVTGTLDLHQELETWLARHKGYPSALLFGSGYLANVGTRPVLVDRPDIVYADRLIHASLIDAAVLSRATLRRYRHNDCEHLETLLKRSPAAGRRLVVTESVFSMDGDRAPLADITKLARDHGAMLLVDEAHAGGVFGPHGGGLVRAHGLEPSVNVSMGTLSKALGSYGGFVTSSPELRALLVNRARAFIYTTALPPAACGAALAALQLLRRHGDWGNELLRRSRFFRRRLQDAGLDTMHSDSQIVPLLVGDNEKTLRLAARLRERHLIAIAIRPPTVPWNRARLRLSVTLAHTEEDLAEAAEIIIETARRERIL